MGAARDAAGVEIDPKSLSEMHLERLRSASLPPLSLTSRSALRTLLPYWQTVAGAEAAGHAEWFEPESLVPSTSDRVGSGLRTDRRIQ